MADLDDLAAFARQRRLDLTKPLSHQQVVALAEAWIPEIRFHHEERFHPVDVAATLTVPPPIFAAMSEEERADFRVALVVGRDEDRNPIVELFDPPVVRGGAVLASGADALAAMSEIDDLGDGPEYSHGHRETASRRFFGASTTVGEGDTPTPGDPRTPRHLPIVVHAELRMLLEALKHELELDDLPPELAGHGHPIDAIWPGFDVHNTFFRADNPRRPPRFSSSQKRGILRDLVRSHEEQDPDLEDQARSRIPEGWQLFEPAWEAVRTYAFLEYYLFYAFNDYASYGDGPFSNEHEGDVEGCCLVFERERLGRYAQNQLTAEEVAPHSIITSAHETFQELDELKRLPIGADRARDDLLVYVARGSHASYLTPGPHDILDFEDVLTDLPRELPAVLLAATFPLAMAIAFFLAVWEFGVDAEDHTSDNGASVGPGGPDPGNLKFAKRIEVTPLSDFRNGVNIYQDVPAQRARLPIRGFRGTWGGDSGILDHSPNWRNKTGRYFRRFVGSANIDPDPVVDVD